MPEPATTAGATPASATPSSAIPDHVEHRIALPDGRTLALAEWGDPHGLPVLAIHGTPGGRISWWGPDPSIDARHGLRRFSLDRPGYGESTRQPGRRVVDLVADLVTVADTLGLGRFAVTGGSGGGPHALALAALLPERVLRCLAVVSVAPIGPDGLAEEAWLDGMTEGNVLEFRAAMAGEAEIRALCEAERGTILARLADGRSDILGDAYELAEQDRTQMARHSVPMGAQMAHALAPGVDGWVDDDLALVQPWGFDVAAIEVPVRLSYGRADTLVPAAHGDWLASAIPGAAAEVSEVGHMGDDADVERHRAWLAGAWA
ncbi:MAG: alpha/beta hydrolase [Candidatus Nanopelagicales bacterium]|jgi:pimeloyl-ACP methyl ester carboxylesterase|nr:alpha/beta hydrolase [Candidatus Nanopelagicales bacterium]